MGQRMSSNCVRSECSVSDVGRGQLAVTSNLKTTSHFMVCRERCTDRRHVLARNTTRLGFLAHLLVISPESGPSIATSSAYRLLGHIFVAASARLLQPMALYGILWVFDLMILDDS